MQSWRPHSACPWKRTQLREPWTPKQAASHKCEWTLESKAAKRSSLLRMYVVQWLSVVCRSEWWEKCKWLFTVESFGASCDACGSDCHEARDGMFLKQRQNESGYTLITQSWAKLEKCFVCMRSAAWCTMEILLSRDGQWGNTVKHVVAVWSGNSVETMITTHEEALRLWWGPTFGKHKKQIINARHPNIFSHTRECVAFVCDFGRCTVYTHMVARVEIDIVAQTKQLKKWNKCTQFSTSACLAIQTTMNRMESANFLMMNFVHRNLQLVTQNVWCAGRCVRIDELFEVLHIAGSVSIDAVGFGGLAAIVNTNLCPAATASFFTSRGFSWLQRQVLCCCLDCLKLFIQVLSHRTLSAYVWTCE